MIFKVGPNETEAFVSIISVTALVLPIAFLGLVAEGTLKGFEEYGWLRLTEVGSSALYVAAVYVAVWRNAPFEWIAYAYLAMLVVRYLVLGFVAGLLARSRGLRLTSWRSDSRQDVVHRCWLMFNGRIVGTFQQTVPPLLIGVLFTPTEVGTFDLLTRLPRFLKATMGPLYSVILPISTHIEETTDTRRRQILGRNGLVLPAAIVIPVLVVIGLFSQEILMVWVGPQYADQWPWMALSLFVPAVSIMLGAGQTALIVRPDFLRVNTRYLYWQVFTQYAVTAITLAWLRERAFILGWVLSHVVFAPLIARGMLSFLSLPKSLFWDHVRRQAIVAAILIVTIGAYKMHSGPQSIAGLVVVGGLACVAAWVLSAALILSPKDRAMFGRFARAFTPRQ
jgi:O-antigen/teichoic acid export membrane protein